MAATHRQERQRERLETLADVIYGVTIVLLVSAMPTPHSEGLSDATLMGFLSESYELLVSGAVALVLLVTYWMQNNALNGVLGHTDGRHSVMSISQLIVMLCYFYSIALSADLDHPTPLLFVQSGALALMGLIGIGALRHATRAGLVKSDVPPDEIRELRTRLVPEPLTAALTLFVAPFGIGAWSLAWLAYPVLAFVTSRVARTRRDR